MGIFIFQSSVRFCDVFDHAISACLAGRSSAASAIEYDSLMYFCEIDFSRIQTKLKGQTYSYLFDV